MKSKKEYRTFGKNRSMRIDYFDYSQPYFIYYLTLCTFNKNQYFLNENITIKTISILKSYISKFNYSLMVYCFMPDHLHFLAQANENAGDLRDLVRDLKKFSTKCFWQLGGTGKLWQRSYFEHILRKRENINRVTEYILNNPVRAELVDRWEDYPYCGL